MHGRNMSRWDKDFLFEAKRWSARSKDPSTKCGAAIKRPDNTLASVGYNGLAPGVDDSQILDRDFKIACVIHAEANAILKARDPILDGYSLYVWGLPCCGQCTAQAISKGIKQIVCVQVQDRPDWEASMRVAKKNADDARIIYEVFRLNEIDPLLRDAVIPVFEGDLPGGLEWS